MPDCDQCGSGKTCTGTWASFQKLSEKPEKWSKAIISGPPKDYTLYQLAAAETNASYGKFITYVKWLGGKCQ